MALTPIPCAAFTASPHALPCTLAGGLGASTSSGLDGDDIDDAAIDWLLCDLEADLLRRRAQIAKRSGYLNHRLRSARLDAAQFDGDEVNALREELSDAQRAIYTLVSEALHRRHGAADVERWCRDAVALGAAHPRISAALLSDLLHLRRVPNEPFRQRIAKLRAHGRSENDLVQRCYEELRSARLAKEIKDHQRRSYVRALTGVALTGTGSRQGRRPSVRLWVPYRHAEALCQALDMSTYEAGV